MFSFKSAFLTLVISPLASQTLYASSAPSAYNSAFLRDGQHDQTYQIEMILKKVAWYKDRDNSLIVSDDPAAKAKF